MLSVKLKLSTTIFPLVSVYKNLLAVVVANFDKVIVLLEILEFVIVVSANFEFVIEPSIKLKSYATNAPFVSVPIHLLAVVEANFDKAIVLFEILEFVIVVSANFELVIEQSIKLKS